MSPFANKGKAKGREARRSRSRNTTPSSVLSAGTGPFPLVPAVTPYLEIDTSKLLVATSPQYGDILERLETKPGGAEPKHLGTLLDLLRHLSEAAEARAKVCDAAMRELASRRKEIADDERERERLEREAEIRKAKSRKDAEDADEEIVTGKPGKIKKRKDRSMARGDIEGVVVKSEGRQNMSRLLSTMRSLMVWYNNTQHCGCTTMCWACYTLPLTPSNTHHLLVFTPLPLQFTHSTYRLVDISPA